MLYEVGLFTNSTATGNGANFFDTQVERYSFARRTASHLLHTT